MPSIPLCMIPPFYELCRSVFNCCVFFFFFFSLFFFFFLTCLIVFLEFIYRNVIGQCLTAVGISSYFYDVKAVDSSRSSYGIYGMVNDIGQCLTAVVIIQFVVFSGKDKVQGYWSVFNCDSHLINLFAYLLVVSSL